MRSRRVAIDIKKQVRGRTVRTAVISLGDHRDADDTSLPRRTPVGRRSVLSRAPIRAQLGADPCSVLSAHVHRVSLVHKVGATLAMANQSCDEGSAELAHGVQVIRHRLAPRERPGGLTHQREEI